MESVNKIRDLNSHNEEILEVKNETQKIDRVVLDSASIKIVEEMIEQIESRWGDLVNVSQKDIVNFLLQKRSIRLTEQEIDLIRLEKFDIVRVLKRATTEAIRAKQSGKEIEIEEILKIIQTPSINVEVAPVKVRKRKIKLNSSPDMGVEFQRSDSSEVSLKGQNRTNLENTKLPVKTEEKAKIPELKKP